MGLTVLYLAFGIVALWLLGEVLLQYKARLRFRLLAFVGFLGVVLGVLMHSVPVIGLGAAAFTVGQTYVTLSFRQGFAQGWAIKGPGVEGKPGKPSKRRRGEPEDADAPEDNSDLEEVEVAAYRREDEYTADEDDVFTPAPSDRFAPPEPAEPTAAESTSVYEPQPLPEDTGSYGVYDAAAYSAAADQSYAGASQSQDQEAYSTGQNQQAYATGQNQQAYAYDGYTGYDQQQYGYGTGQQQYATYTDPYTGQQTYTGATYDQSAYAGGDQQYAQQQQQNYGQDQYANGTYGGETPSGGVWVPQQRTDEYGGELPPEQQQQYPYQGNNNGNAGYDEQYRY
ncbi:MULTISPECIES: hypothetical protein [unclassified Streptomyces]|uniref:SCO2102 family sporulation regulator n=1 Tax=unclassified Streptomyces TaxID=2593676 RepID=UPI0033BED05E